MHWHCVYLAFFAPADTRTLILSRILWLAWEDADIEKAVGVRETPIQAEHRDGGRNWDPVDDHHALA